MTSRRILVAVVATVLLLVALSYVLFSAGSDSPGDGEGDPLRQSSAPAVVTAM